MKGPSDHLIKKTEDAVSRATQKPAAGEGDLFSFAGYDTEASEKTGYSNYSYWGCTFRAFMKNKVAVTLLCVLAFLVAFTFVQPLLPNQYEATRIINHPITGMQMSNVTPSFSTVRITVPAGTELIVTRQIDEAWAAVSNVLDTIKARVKFTVLEYGAEWCMVSFRGTDGYVKNDFTTKLKLPGDAGNTPYEAYANFPVKLYLDQEDLTNNGAELFAPVKDLAFRADGKTAVTSARTGLCLLPSGAPLLFGTNNAGQDLWAMVWSGTRTSLFIGFTVALAEAAAGIFVGVIWGYVRKLDRILTEVYNVVDNIPTTIVLILIAYILRPGVSTLIFAMCLTGWIGMALFIRNQIVIIRDRDYNLASRCLGTGTFRIIVRNLLPYLVSVITLRMALAVPRAIGSEVFITYIGLGLPLATPSLGNLITVGRKLISTSQSYQLYFPTIVLSVITISFYIIGNAFSDSADPRNHL
jgi:ABC-type dipeptide/oligopeptide/nickel transport system permease subunit